MNNKTIELTKEQALVLTGFTGIMCCKSFSDYHADVEKRLGHPVMTHQFPSLSEKIKVAYTEDFMKIVGVSND